MSSCELACYFTLHFLVVSHFVNTNPILDLSGEMQLKATCFKSCNQQCVLLLPCLENYWTSSSCINDFAFGFFKRRSAFIVNRKHFYWFSELSDFPTKQQTKLWRLKYWWAMMLKKYDLDIQMLSVCSFKEIHLIRHFTGFISEVTRTKAKTEFDLSWEFCAFKCVPYC